MLWVLLLAVCSLFFAWWGTVAARSRGRSAILWGLVCALTFFIGIAIVYSLGGPRRQLAVVGEEAEPFGAATDLPLEHEPHTLMQTQPLLLTGESPDDQRWRYLCEYHPAVGEVLARVEPMGEAALQELKSAYLALDDAALLPAILTRLQERFGGGKRTAVAAADTRRQVRAAEDSDEPIDLVAPVTSNGRARASNTSAPSRMAKVEPEHDILANASRHINNELADAGVDQVSWQPIYGKDRQQRDESAMADASNSPAQPSDSDRDIATSRKSMDGGTANGSRFESPNTLLAKKPPRHDEQELTLNGQHIESPTQAIATALRPPEHRTVAPADLEGARYIETYSGLHLFALADGRVFVDRHEALGSLDMARSYVDTVKAKQQES